MEKLAYESVSNLDEEISVSCDINTSSIEPLKSLTKRKFFSDYQHLKCTNFFLRKRTIFTFFCY